jgi:hypothetical protein
MARLFQYPNVETKATGQPVFYCLTFTAKQQTDTPWPNLNPQTSALPRPATQRDGDYHDFAYGWSCIKGVHTATEEDHQLTGSHPSIYSNHYFTSILP